MTYVSCLESHDGTIAIAKRKKTVPKTRCTWQRNTQYYTAELDTNKELSEIHCQQERKKKNYEEGAYWVDRVHGSKKRPVWVGRVEEEETHSTPIGHWTPIIPQSHTLDTPPQHPQPWTHCTYSSVHTCVHVEHCIFVLLRASYSYSTQYTCTLARVGIHGYCNMPYHGIPNMEYDSCYCNTGTHYPLPTQVSHRKLYSWVPVLQNCHLTTACTI